MKFDKSSVGLLPHLCLALLFPVCLIGRLILNTRVRPLFVVPVDVLGSVLLRISSCDFRFNNGEKACPAKNTDT